IRGERHDGGAFRLDAGNFAIAKRLRAGWTLEGNREHEPARRASAPGKELFDRHIARAVAALHRNGRVEREQGDSEIAKWRWREQIAANRAHVTHRRPADRAGDRMEKRQLTLREHAREGDAGADRAPAARTIEMRSRALCSP